MCFAVGLAQLPARRQCHQVFGGLIAIQKSGSGSVVAQCLMTMPTSL